jgi:hypothetical protein
MTMHGFKHQWPPLLYGQALRDEFARLWKVVHRVTERPGSQLNRIMEPGFLPFAAVSGCIIFLLGLSLPNRVAVGILYAGIVLLGLWSPQRYASHWLAGGGTVLLVLGFVVSNDDRSTIPVMVDRSFAFISLWLVGLINYLCHRPEWKNEQGTRDLEIGVVPVKTSQAVFPICVFCKNVCTGHNGRESMQRDVEAHLETGTQPLICPDCRRLQLATQAAG